MKPIVFLFFISSFLAGCVSPKGAMKTPSHPTGVEVSAPERRASDALIEEGIRTMDNGRYDRAADLFQEAITIDSTNGAGYYRLAFVKVKMGEYGEARGLLEKAEHLLAGDSEWKTKLEELRAELGESE